VPQATQGQEGAGEPPPYRPSRVGPPGPGAAPKRPSRWLDRIVGVVLGLLLGLAVIIVFVFEGSEGTIDAPRISGIDTGQRQTGPPLGGATRLPLVRVIDGMPPPSGPVRLDFKQGSTARFVVDSDQQIGIEITGYGVSRRVGAAQTIVAFRAAKPGQYPVVVSPSHIDVATLHVARHPSEAP
jgi:hypothetical protein